MRFVKQILRPGTYLAKKPDGERVKVQITPERMKGWVEKFNKMTGKGLQIPAPWRHDLTAVPTGGAEIDSKSNAGFWKKLWIENDYLTGELDAPVAEDQAKIGKTVTEVSPYILPEWADGDGDKWDDSILHIALVTNPVVPRQTNFVPQAEVQPALALSLSLDDFLGGILMADETQVTETTQQGGPPSIKEAIAVLAKAGIVLPEDTTAENLVERIVIAGKAAEAAEDENKTDEGETKVPENAVETKPPAMMSLGTVPGFVRPMILKDLGSRVAALIQTGRINQKYADEVLKPSVAGLQFSLDAAGELDLGTLGVQLQTLEALPENPLLASVTTRTPRTGKDGALMAHEEEVPTGYLGTAITEEEAAKIVDAQMANSGR